MELNLINYIKNTVSGQFKAQVPVNVPLSGMLKALRSYNSRLVDTNQSYGVLLDAFGTADDVWTDILYEGDLSTREGLFAIDRQLEISREQYDLLVQGFLDAMTIQNDGDSEVGEMTIIDGTGRSYSFQAFKNGSVWQVSNKRPGVPTGDYYTLGYTYTGGRWIYYVRPLAFSVDYTNEGDGCVTVIPTLLRSLAITSTINIVTSRFTDLVNKGQYRTESYLAAIGEFTSSKVNSVRKWASTLRTVICNYGIIGGVKYILSCLASVATATDDNGALVFTDNKALIPAEFIGTFISGLFTTVGAILLVVGGIVAKIIGFAVTLVGKIMSFFFGSVKNNYDGNTVAALLDSSIDDDGFAEALQMAPVAILQCDIAAPRSDHTWDHIWDFLDNVSNAGFIEVPGGYILFGSANMAETLRFEFHPDPFKYIDLQVDKWVQWAFYSQNQCLFVMPKTKPTKESLEGSWDMAQVVSYEYTALSNSNGQPVMTSASDGVCRQVIVKNIGLFLLYMYVTETQRSNTTRNYLFKDWTADTHIGFTVNGDASGVALLPGQHLCSAFKAAYIPLHMVCGPIWNATSGTSGASVTASVPSWSQITQWCDDVSRVLSITGCFQSTTQDSADALSVSVPGYISSGQWYPTWSSIAWTQVGSVGEYEVLVPGPISYLLAYRFWFGDMTPISKLLFALAIPRYNRSTFWLYVVGTIVAVTVTAVATVVATVKINKWRKLKRAQSAAAVESAWTELTNNPNSVEAAKNYKKAAFKANIGSKIWGGTAYDTSNYWNTGSDEPTATATDSGDILSTYFGSDAASEDADIQNLIYGSIVGTPTV